MPLIQTSISSLNPAQLRAVIHPPETALQILAGPGSGKTKVLTSRIAHLIIDCCLPPSSICAVTFTNKAANEMRERLTKLIGREKTAEVRMGTFHALCALFLRKYGNIIGLEGNFTVCDAEESKKIISKLLKQYEDHLAAKNVVLKEGTVISLISKAKAKGHTAADIRAQNRTDSRNKTTSGAFSYNSDVECIVAEIYQEYEQSLRRNNSLDFDDLLLFGVKLFSKHEKAVNWCRHMLVDEFQDTNIMQYELMRSIAPAQRVTVVGDPDQSIYGWRSAEVENLSKMCKDFPSTKQIFLEQNYRSTASILKASLAIVAQDKSRIQKSLHTSHPIGTTPVLRLFTSEYEEAAFIAIEIKRLAANMTLRWGDFAVLLRFTALSRTIENALQREGIPSRVLGGHKFFERLEIKDLLAYLQLVDNPHYSPAFARAINVPSRGIGEKTLGEIVNRANQTKFSQLEVVEQIYDLKSPDIKPPIKRKAASFVKAIRTLRNLAMQGTSPADLIRRLLELIGYENHLKTTQLDWESRWENVQELITFASEVEVDGKTQTVDQHSSRDESSDEMTYLRLFLQASMLSSEGDNQNEADSGEKVVISTCHGAKGLEWPVVIVPAVEQGTFPFYRSDDIEEERRLLYVACTRAQGLLYLSHTTKRKVAGVAKTKEISGFVSTVIKQNETLFTDRTPSFSPANRAAISKVLGRPEPQASEVARRVAEFEGTTRYHLLEHEDNINSRHSLLTSPVTNTSNEFTASSSVLNVLPTSSGRQREPLLPTQNLTSTAYTPTSAVIPLLPLQPLQTTGPPTNVAQKHPSLPMSSVDIVSMNGNTQVPHATLAPAQGGKRRLGMGRPTLGYSNKKFKPPT